MQRLFFLLASLGFVALLATGAPAGNDAAAQFVQKMGDKALSSLTGRDINMAERETRVRDLLRNNFDVPTIGRFALGTHWKAATEAERAEYMKLFESMIVKTYAQRFSEYEGQEFKVGGTTPAGKDFLVASQILQDGGPAVIVEWRVRDSGSGMKVIDVLVEGISMSVTQRSDFSSVIQQGGGKMSALLSSLRSHQGIKKSAKAG